jgi:NADPH2:quinone reductase
VGERGDEIAVYLGIQLDRSNRLAKISRVAVHPELSKQNELFEQAMPRLLKYLEEKGVDVVYDSVGKTTFLQSLDCLKRFGMIVSFGQSSGAIPAFDPQILSQKGSLYLTRPTLMHHIEDAANYARMAAEFFDLVQKKIVTVRIGGLYHLGEVKQAHIDLEARKTTGALVLTV